jgi:predicted RNA-binding protein associated with RNAse of E/G family
LDEDELEQALKDNDITKEQYELAYFESQKLIHNIQENKEILPLNSKFYLQHMVSLG